MFKNRGLKRVVFHGPSCFSRPTTSDSIQSGWKYGSYAVGFLRFNLDKFMYKSILLYIHHSVSTFTDKSGYGIFHHRAHGRGDYQLKFLKFATSVSMIMAGEDGSNAGPGEFSNHSFSFGHCNVELFVGDMRKHRRLEFGLGTSLNAKLN